MDRAQDSINARDREDSADITFRSGVAARLAGMSVETLRVWERRYALSDARRSKHGQRQYSADQIYRLSLLKQLVDQGHPIGALARLATGRLRTMAGGDPIASARTPAPIRAVVVGASLAPRLAASVNDGLPFEIQASWRRLDQVPPSSRDTVTDVLLVELSELDERAAPGIAAANLAVQALSVVVLYRFCSTATVRVLRRRGWLVARIPAEMGELLPLCRSALTGQRFVIPAQCEALAPRRFDDETLTQLATLDNRASCECPRHLSELLLMIGSFERYSAQCSSRDSADAQLHRNLEHAAARARTILESTMEQLIQHEGWVLPSKANTAPKVRQPVCEPGQEQAAEKDTTNQ